MAILVTRGMVWPLEVVKLASTCLAMMMTGAQLLLLLLVVGFAPGPILLGGKGAAALEDLLSVVVLGLLGWCVEQLVLSEMVVRFPGWDVEQLVLAVELLTKEA